MRDDLPAGSKECPKCGAPIWRDCETSPDEIGEDRVTVTFESEGRNFTENYPPACLAPRVN